MWYLPSSEGNSMEEVIPTEYDVSPLFRTLEIEHAVMQGRDGRTYSTKQANYMKVETDGTGRPVDAPILRALCERLGTEDIRFVHEWSDEQKNFQCAMVVRRPMEPTPSSIQRTIVFHERNT